MHLQQSLSHDRAGREVCAGIEAGKAMLNRILQSFNNLETNASNAIGSF